MVRKTPVRHSVGSYKRKDGTKVSSHEKGRGTRSRKSSRIVGKIGIDWPNAKGISMTYDQSKWEIAEDAYRAIGWKTSERMMEVGDRDFVVDGVTFALQDKGYEPKRMTEAQVRAYTEIEEDEDVLPFDYWMWRKGSKVVVVIH